jgi:hypothetical protein
VAELLPPFRDYLVSQGIVRKPSVAGSTPPLWLEPRLGVPAPGEGNDPTEIGADAVIGAWTSSGIAPQPFNAGRRLDFIDIRMRTKIAPTAHQIEEQIRVVLLDKRNWQMSTLTIIETLIYRELQSLGSDEQGFDWVMTFSFERYSGLP